MYVTFVLIGWLLTAHWAVSNESTPNALILKLQRSVHLGGGVKTSSGEIPGLTCAGVRRARRARGWSGPFLPCWHRCVGSARPPSPGRSACVWSYPGGRRKLQNTGWWRHWGWGGGWTSPRAAAWLCGAGMTRPRGPERVSGGPTAAAGPGWSWFMIQSVGWISITIRFRSSAMLLSHFCRYTLQAYSGVRYFKTELYSLINRMTEIIFWENKNEMLMELRF